MFFLAVFFSSSLPNFVSLPLLVSLSPPLGATTAGGHHRWRSPPLEVEEKQGEEWETKIDTQTFFSSSPPPVVFSSFHQVIVVLPSNRKDRYDAIKKFCCVDHPVPSQCILGRTLSKKQTIMSVTTKVAMQLNCKLGGELWALEVPVSWSPSVFVSVSFLSACLRLHVYLSTCLSICLSVFLCECVCVHVHACVRVCMCM